MAASLGIDPAVPAGYENLSYVVRIMGSGTKEYFADLAQLLQRVPARSPQTHPHRRVIDGLEAWSEAAAAQRLSRRLLPRCLLGVKVRPMLPLSPGQQSSG